MLWQLSAPCTWLACVTRTQICRVLPGQIANYLKKGPFKQLSIDLLPSTEQL